MQNQTFNNKRTVNVYEIYEKHGINFSFELSTQLLIAGRILNILHPRHQDADLEDITFDLVKEVMKDNETFASITGDNKDDKDKKDAQRVRDVIQETFLNALKSYATKHKLLNDSIQCNLALNRKTQAIRELLAVTGKIDAMPLIIDWVVGNYTLKEIIFFPVVWIMSRLVRKYINAVACSNASTIDCARALLIAGYLDAEYEIMGSDIVFSIPRREFNCTGFGSIVEECQDLINFRHK